MKRVLVSIFCLFVGVAICAAAPKEKKSEANPEAGGVTIQPSEGEIAAGDELTITFPEAMVATDKIDMVDQPAPFVSAPAMEGTFLWKSQTEGVFTVKSVTAGAEHRLTLLGGLTDAAGKRVEAPGWSADFTAAPFNITSDFEERKHLNVQPQISLESTYNVRLSEVAEHVYFQDRDSRERLPVDVILWSEEKLSEAIEAKEFRVSPRQLLPVGHTY
ncbi:MAG: hypothetical protein ABJB69_07360, partial [Spartobacteria bacterium]